MYPEPGRQLLSSSEKTALKRLEKSNYIQVCKKGNRQSEHQRSGIKLRNLAFYSMGRFKPLLLLLSHFSRVQLCEILSLEFSRQEHWSGLPFPSPMYKSEK